MKVTFENVETERCRLPELREGETAVLLEHDTRMGQPAGTVVARFAEELFKLGGTREIIGGWQPWRLNALANTRIQILRIVVTKERRPFSVEEAEAGRRVVTRRGVEVKYIGHDLDNSALSRVVCSYNHGFQAWRIDGRYFEGEETMMDLFMED